MQKHRGDSLFVLSNFIVNISQSLSRIIVKCVPDVRNGFRKHLLPSRNLSRSKFRFRLKYQFLLLKMGLLLVETSKQEEKPELKHVVFCFIVYLLLVLSLHLFFQETNPSPSQPDEDGAEQTGQEIVSPEAYIKHPLQNRQRPQVYVKRPKVFLQASHDTFGNTSGRLFDELFYSVI